MIAHFAASALHCAVINAASAAFATVERKPPRAKPAAVRYRSS